jgi:integrase
LKGCTNRDVQHERYAGAEWIRRLRKETPLCDVTHQQLLQIKKQMVDGGRQEQTAHNYFSFLKKVFNLAIKDHTRTGVTINPCKGIRFEKSEQVIKRLSEGQLSELNEIMHPEDYQAVELAIETMLRRGPFFRWRWADIDLERKEFTLLKASNKGKKTLTLPLSDYAVAILKSRLSFGFSPWVFPSRHDPNTPRDAKTFYQDVYLPALRKRGIPIPPDKKAWHMLRHTGATRRLLAGCPMPVLRDLLGHSTLHMTERYVNLVKEDLRRGIEQGSLGEKTHRESVARSVAGGK